MKRALLVALIACSSRPPHGLADHLAALREDRAVPLLEMSSEMWRRTVVEPYSGLHGEYLREFAAARPQLESQIYRGGAIAARQHYADDPQLTFGQGRTRWALRVLEASRVATNDGQPIDAVFVQGKDYWFAIVGIDRVVRRHVDAFDPACGALIDGSNTKGCREIAWEVADAALRNQRERVDHACALARTACGKPAP